MKTMNFQEAAAYANDLTSLTETERIGIALMLTAGRLTICPDCRFVMQAGLTMCEICDAAMWEEQAAKYDARLEEQGADMDWFAARQTAMAGHSQGFDVADYEFRNFCGAVN